MREFLHYSRIYCVSTGRVVIDVVYYLHKYEIGGTDDGISG